jgi:CRP/FNR family cyclic AMP-dependent transcriptional regulator
MSLETPQLPATGLVAHIDKEDRDALSSYGTFHMAKPGTVLIEQGKSHGKLFYIVSGLFHARRSDGETDILLGRVQPGEWVGEVDLFDPSNAVCSVVAVDPSQYWMITREDLEEFINNYPRAGTIMLIGIASTLGRRIRALTAKLSEQSELTKIREQLYMDAEFPASAHPAGGI